MVCLSFAKNCHGKALYVFCNRNFVNDSVHKIFMSDLTCKHNSHAKGSRHSSSTVIITISKLNRKVGHRLSAGLRAHTLVVDKPVILALDTGTFY